MFSNWCRWRKWYDFKEIWGESGIGHVSCGCALSHRPHLFAGIAPLQSFSNLIQGHTFTSLLIGLATNILKKVTAPPKVQVAFPNRRDGRICFYGYVSRKWLIEYATAHWCWGPLDSGCYYDASKATGAIKILRTRSGIDLNFQTALTDPSINAVTFQDIDLERLWFLLYQSSVTRTGYRPGNGQPGRRWTDCLKF